MLEITPGPGHIAESRQGHDKGRLYVIISAADKDFVMLSDGGTRPLAKQKRKRLKHLKLHGVTAEGIEAKLTGADRKKLYDTEIKRALKLYREKKNKKKETGEPADKCQKATISKRKES